jgi:hypothetical protein
MLYWKLPNNKFMAFVPRTGSTAWGQAILDQFYPDEKLKQQRAVGPNNDLAGPQYFIPNESEPPIDAEILGVIRNPIERFRSGFIRAANGRNIDQFISDLLSGKDKSVNVHIRPVVQQFDDYLSIIKWHKYETDLPALAAAIGLSGVPSLSNESNQEDKPDLSSDQIEKLQQYYADDIALYNSLT